MGDSKKGEQKGLMRSLLLGLLLVAAVHALKDSHSDVVANIQLAQIDDNTSANDTMEVAFDPLEPAQIVSGNVEVTSRIFQSCIGGDYSARWSDRQSAKS